MDGDTWSFSPVHEQAAANVRAAFLTAQLQRGATIAELQEKDSGRELIMPLLRAEHHLRNVDKRGKYLLWRNQWNPSSQQAHTCPLAWRVNQAGNPRLRRLSRRRPDLARSEAELAHLLSIDPLCISSHPQTKGCRIGSNGYDDPSFLRFVRRLQA